MMKQSIPQITIIWGFRKQTLKECTEESIIFLEKIKLLDKKLSSWYKTDNNKKNVPKNKIIIEYDYIKEMFCSKCNENEYPEYSFMISIWNGNNIDSLSYGMLLTIGGARIGNNMVQFTFPSEGEVYDYYIKKENWRKLLELFIDHWDPDKYKDFNGNLIEL